MSRRGGGGARRAAAPRYPFLDHPGLLAFAHRGAHGGDVPENTMRAFGRAVDLGFRYLETDVHLTADGVLVAFHDDRLERVTDGTGILADLPWSEVSAARVGDTDPIPRLDELLETFPEARFNLDPKHDAALEPLLDALRRHDALDRVCVAAFSDERLARARSAVGPRLCTGLGPREIARLVAASRRVAWFRTEGAAAQVPIQHKSMTIVTPRFVAAAHRRGLQVHVWTIDDAAEMERLVDLGVDGIMTDRAEVLRDVLVARGRWS
jgi:glycerophosphoryl diester phosphodiesterase